MRIGADPELFAVDLEGKFRSFIGKVGGTKQHPLVIRDDGCAVQEDNVAAEFNIPPCESAEKFIEAINFNLEHLRTIATNHGLNLSISASAEFPLEELLDPKAMEFGCDPDFNAWTEKVNLRPRSRNKYLRSAGGHVHIETEMNPYHVARAFDLCCVIPSLALDGDTRRRELYGKAGACRPKPYGVECRALSNFWLASDELKAWVFNQTQKAVKFAEQQRRFSQNESLRIQSCINTSNLGLMREIVDEYGLAA